MQDVPLGALLVAFIVLLVISGFFSISETSMMALNRYRLRHMVQSGRPGAKRTADLLARTDRLLGGILLGNNLANAAAAMLAGIITERLLGESELALLLATLLVTFALLVFAEISPKVVGATYPERIALRASWAVAPILKLFDPAVWFVNLFARGLLRPLGLLPKPGQHEQRLSLEELRTMVLEAEQQMPPRNQQMLLNILELASIKVDDVMAPRSQIEAVDLNQPWEALCAQLATSHHTRILAYRDTLDQVEGILHIRRVLPLLTRHEETGLDELGEALAEPYYIPAGTQLLSQVQQFQDNRERLALVVDEYGELLGLVTLEDILEEIVGEFTTHGPTYRAPYAVQEDGSILVEGAALLRELNRKLGLALPLGGSKTVNGLILEHFQDIPEPGTTIRINDYPVEIVQTQDRVVKTARIHPALPARD